MDVAWIDSTDRLSAWLSTLSPGPLDRLAVDTEADSFHHYREKVCLVQLSAGDRHALVDPLAGVDLSLLSQPLSDPAIVKILHGADYDIRLLSRDFSLRLDGLYDTMIAARLLGEPAVGLQALLQKYLDVSLDKSHQRADWSKRPLSPAMREYAVADTRHLAELASRLGARLDALGRAAWMREECERLQSVRWRDRREDDPEPFLRTKGVKDLDPAALAVLREIWVWRDATAAAADRPPFRIARDEVLIAVARRPPAILDELRAVPGVPAPLSRAPWVEPFLEAVRRGAACPEGERPKRAARVVEKLPAPVVARVSILRDARDRLARDLQLDPTLLASRATLEDVATRWVDGLDPWTAPELRAWQTGLLRGALSPEAPRSA